MKEVEAKKTGERLESSSNVHQSLILDDIIFMFFVL
jgi:hypothetical protein